MLRQGAFLSDSYSLDIVSLKFPTDATLASMSILHYSRWRTRWQQNLQKMK